ncbi:MAG: general secretion pathway protein GspB [Desulfobacterales bacterium]
MSSILKALKKLEDENPPKGRSVVWSSGTAPRGTIRRWDITSGWSAVLLWGLLMAVALISVGGIVLYLLSPSDRNAVPTASVGQPVAKPILESLPPETVAKLPPQPPPVPTPKEASPPTAPPMEKAAPMPKVVPPPAVKKVPSAPRKKKPPVRAVEAEPDRAATADLPVLTTDLKLQAISWASAPGDRLAVINGNIMREGASLEGYSIVQIDRDEVVVRKGSEQWKLVFKLR